MPESSDGQAAARGSATSNNQASTTTRTDGNDAGDPGSGRSNRRRNRRNRRAQRMRVPAFEGPISELKDAVFDLDNSKTYFSDVCNRISNYIGVHIKDGSAFSTLLEERILPAIEQPVRPPDDATNLDISLYLEAMKNYNKKVDVRARAGSSVYSLLKGQCSPALLSHMKSERGWANLNIEKDPERLLNLIERCLTRGKTAKHPVVASVEGKLSIIEFKQGRYMSSAEYYDRFLDTVRRAESNHGNIAANMERVKQLLLEDGIRDVERSRGLGDVYKRQSLYLEAMKNYNKKVDVRARAGSSVYSLLKGQCSPALLSHMTVSYTHLTLPTILLV